MGDFEKCRLIRRYDPKVATHCRPQVAPLFPEQKPAKTRYYLNHQKDYLPFFHHNRKTLLPSPRQFGGLAGTVQDDVGSTGAVLRIGRRFRSVRCSKLTINRASGGVILDVNDESPQLCHNLRVRRMEMAIYKEKFSGTGGRTRTGTSCENRF